VQGPDLADWPAEFVRLQEKQPRGWIIIDTVLDPALFVGRREERYAIQLGAHLKRRSGVVEMRAPSLACDWVAGGGFVCPLPRDIGRVLATTLTGIDPFNLTFPEVLELRRKADSGLPVEFEKGIWEPANRQAAQLKGDIVVPALNADLYSYQAKGIAWMHAAIEKTGGVILADEMGLGKTIQVIGLLLINVPGPAAPALVICPTTLIANWVREVTKFAPSLSISIHRGPDRARLPRHLLGSQIVVTTYETLVNDLVLFKAVPWSWMICDEAQAIKNPASNRRRAVAQIPRQRAIPVTGTPVENHLLDLWSLVDIAVPGLLGSEAQFATAFPDTSESAELLGDVTSAIVLRRRVSDVAQDLPERIDVEVPLELGQSLAQEYEAVRQEVLDQYPVAGAMVATGQLQLFCAHPDLTSESGVEGGRKSPDQLVRSTPKLERALQLLDEAFRNGRKALVFANFNACSNQCMFQVIAGVRAKPSCCLLGGNKRIHSAAHSTRNR
jgi:SNF2 family DNA or RNA helicase